MPGDCIFCSIAAGKAPADVILETDHAVAFRDLNPMAPTHILVIPREHYTNILDTPPESMAELHRAVKQVVQQEGIADKGFRTVINTHRSAGQSVFHLHIHILAGRPLRWPPG